MTSTDFLGLVKTIWPRCKLSAPQLEEIARKAADIPTAQVEAAFRARSLRKFSTVSPQPDALIEDVERIEGAIFAGKSQPDRETPEQCSARWRSQLARNHERADIIRREFAGRPASEIFTFMRDGARACYANTKAPPNVDVAAWREREAMEFLAFALMHASARMHRRGNKFLAHLDESKRGGVHRREIVGAEVGASVAVKHYEPPSLGDILEIPGDAAHGARIIDADLAAEVRPCRVLLAWALGLLPEVRGAA